MDKQDLLKQFKSKVNEIQALVSKRHKLEGQKEQIMSDLFKKFDLSSIDTAVKKFEELNSNLVLQEEGIRSRLVKLEEVVQRAN
jgi:Fic family protein